MKDGSCKSKEKHRRLVIQRRSPASESSVLSRRNAFSSAQIVLFIRLGYLLVPGRNWRITVVDRSRKFRIDRLKCSLFLVHRYDGLKLNMPQNRSIPSLYFGFLFVFRDTIGNFSFLEENCQFSIYH